jgi:hypothetical protein
MSRDNLAICVHSERPIVGLERYELSVYRLADEFYATWFCSICGCIHETSRCDSQSSAQESGVAAIEAHHAELHRRDGA